MWQVVGASTRGTAHIRSDTPCQDVHGYRILKNCVVAAVADGLGSATNSDQGAKIALDEALYTLCGALKLNIPSEPCKCTLLIQDAFTKARRCLQQTAETRGLPVSNYATTLTIAIVLKSWLITGHVGDGTVVALFKDGTLDTVAVPQHGEYINVVTPITALNALSCLCFSVRQAGVKAVALLTDGMQNLSMDMKTGKPFGPFFLPVFQVFDHKIDTNTMSKLLSDFLDSKQVCDRTDDDKTLVIISRISR